jgi:PAS domain-containing protein
MEAAAQQGGQQGGSAATLARDGAELFGRAFNAIPYAVLVVDDDVRILAMNAMSGSLFGERPELVLSRRGGDALHCVHAVGAPGGCGTAEACSTCVVRTSVTRTCREGAVIRRPAHMQLHGHDRVEEVYILVSTGPFPGAPGEHDRPGSRLAVLMFQDIGELVSNQGLVPVCMHCHKVRDTAGAWQPMDLYLKQHLDVDVTHGLCKACLEKHYPDFSEARSPAST